MKHGDLTDKIIGAFYRVYNTLRWGFSEHVYQNALLLNFGPKPQTRRKVFDHPGASTSHTDYNDNPADALFR
jgi:hypothetical protein